MGHKEGSGAPLVQETQYVFSFFSRGSQWVCIYSPHAVSPGSKRWRRFENNHVIEQEFSEEHNDAFTLLDC